MCSNRVNVLSPRSDSNGEPAGIRKFHAEVGDYATAGRSAKLSYAGVE